MTDGFNARAAAANIERLKRLFESCYRTRPRIGLDALCEINCLTGLDGPAPTPSSNPEPCRPDESDLMNVLALGLSDRIREADERATVRARSFERICNELSIRLATLEDEVKSTANKRPRLDEECDSAIRQLRDRITILESKDLPPGIVLGKLDPTEPGEERSVPPVDNVMT